MSKLMKNISTMHSPVILHSFPSQTFAKHFELSVALALNQHRTKMQCATPTNGRAHQFKCLQTFLFFRTTNVERLRSRCFLIRCKLLRSMEIVHPTEV